MTTAHLREAMNDFSAMKLGSLFDGIGGFPWSARRYGIKPVWASEIEPACIRITRRHFPAMKHLGDVSQISGADIEPVDIITFGSPCQDLSIAGKRAGLAGARSGLFGEAIRIIDEMRESTNDTYPRWAVWENVPGALSSNDGLDFRAVLQSFANDNIPMPRSGRWAGAGVVRGERADIAYRILDAQFWGVPQRRRRVFLVADFGGRRAAKVLFEPEGLRRHFATGRAPWERFAASPGNSFAGANDNCRQAANDNRTEYLTGWDIQEKRVFTENGICPTLAGSDGGGGRTLAGYILTAGFNGWRSVSGSLEYAEERAPCVQANMPPNIVVAVHQNQVGAIANDNVAIPINTQVATRHKQLGRGTGFGVGEDGDPAFTLQQAHSHAVFTFDARGNGDGKTANTLTGDHQSRITDYTALLCMAHGQAGAEICRDMSPMLNCNHEQPIVAGGNYAVRRLTPLECERAQGLPDDWTAEGHDGKPNSDSKRYTAIGNSLALPCVDYVLGGIVAADNDNQSEAL